MAAKGSSAEHTALVNAVLIELGKLTWWRGWKRNVGLFHRLKYDDGGKVAGATPIYVGTPGESDIDGIVTCSCGAGIRTHMEAKTGNATQTDEQKMFQAMISSMGGQYSVVRSVADAVTFVDTIRGNCSHRLG